jgi:hypothetical protein
MYDSDRKYLSRFALDPETEYGSEDLYAFDLSPHGFYDDAPEPLDDQKLDAEDFILEDDFLFEK